MYSNVVTAIDKILHSYYISTLGFWQLKHSMSFLDFFFVASVVSASSCPSTCLPT